MSKELAKKIFNVLVYIFAAIGLFFTLGYFAVQFGVTNSSGIVDTQRDNFLSGGANEKTDAKTNGETTGQITPSPTNTHGDYYWANLPEWTTLEAAILKDKAIITQAATAAGVSPRLIVSQLVVEQLRFFFDDRESFKKFFEPLKILGSQTKFSWGVMGIKEDTALQIEANLKNPVSPYYLGPSFEHALDFKTTDIKNERFTRMTDQHDHYYSYLYAGLFLKEISEQWRKAGFDISSRPDILSTLYNIGFKYSVPKANPESGGAPIPIGNTTYSFGTLGGEFYNSNVLIEDFPR